MQNLLMSLCVLGLSFSAFGNEAEDIGSAYRNWGRGIGQYYRNKYAPQSNVKETLQGDVIRITLTGSETRNVQVDAKRVKVRFDGSGELVLTGKTDQLEIDGSGSADVDAEDLNANSVELDLSGSADVRVRANDRFDLTADGSAHIYLYGKGKIERQSLGGAVRLYDHRN